MLPRSVVTLFCDDVRDEKSGAHTIVGVYPDNINLPSFPHIFPRLTVYTRINLDVNDSINEIKAQLISANGEVGYSTTIDKEMISRSQRQSEEKSSLLVSFMGRLVVSPMEIPEPGIVKMVVTMDDQEFLGGFVKITQTQ